MHARFIGFAVITAVEAIMAIHCHGEDMPPVSVEVGDKAATFICQDDRGWTWKLSDKLPENYLVLIFYQGDFQQQDNERLLAYRKNWHALAQRNVDIIGVSGDSVATHRLYKELFCLDFLLLADEDGKVAQKFGVAHRAGGKARVKDSEGKPYLLHSRSSQIVQRGVTCCRCTFLIGPEGTVLYKNTTVDAATECQALLSAVDHHRGGSR